MAIGSGTARPSKERDATGLTPQEFVEITNAWISSEIQRVSAELEEDSKAYAEKLYEKLDTSLDQKLQEASKEFRQQIEMGKTSALQTLALFVALFTFVSVNITIFSKIEYLSAGLWFMFLMLIALITFILTFNVIINARTMSWQKLIINILFVIIIVSVIPILLYVTKNNPKLNPQINTITPNQMDECVNSQADTSH